MPQMEGRPALALAGDWDVGAILAIEPPAVVTVSTEKYDSLPLFDPTAPPWLEGLRLRGVTTQETTARHHIDPASLRLTLDADGKEALVAGQDYEVDLEWGVVGRLSGGRIAASQSVFVSYRYGEDRIDSVFAGAATGVRLAPGESRLATPRPPAPREGETLLANVWVPAWLPKLGPDNLFPILETTYPEPPPETPSPAERLVPRALAKLRNGERLRLLAWGDSVTVGTFVPDPSSQRWQAQLVRRLEARFPQAHIELVTEAWGGHNTTDYLAEPPGALHNYEEKVLGAQPDLVVSEFVNDSGLSPEQVEERYSRLLADFTKIGAEWIILTPHYVRPDWMGFSSERDIDADPRPYTTALREFAPRYNVALGDTSLRWGRLWRQGIPYSTLLMNAINHPDERGMKLYADSAMALFPPGPGDALAARRHPRI